MNLIVGGHSKKDKHSIETIDIDIFFHNFVWFTKFYIIGGNYKEEETQKYILFVNILCNFIK